MLIPGLGRSVSDKTLPEVRRAFKTEGKVLKSVARGPNGPPPPPKKKKKQVRHFFSRDYEKSMKEAQDLADTFNRALKAQDKKMRPNAGGL